MRANLTSLRPLAFLPLYAACLPVQEGASPGCLALVGHAGESVLLLLALLIPMRVHTNAITRHAHAHTRTRTLGHRHTLMSLAVVVLASRAKG